MKEFSRKFTTCLKLPTGHRFVVFFVTVVVSSPLQFGKHFMQFYLEVCLKVLRKDKSYLEEARALRKQVQTTEYATLVSKPRINVALKFPSIAYSLAQTCIFSGFLCRVS